MSHSNGRISAPVGIDADIAPVLGVGSYDLGYLCSNTHGKTNIWARYKPVRYPNLAPTEGMKWWKGSDGNCGIAPYMITSYKDSVDHADGGMNGWEYLAPVGGDASPFRTLDFDGYNHNVKGPIGSFNVPGSATNQFVDSTFSCSVSVMQYPDPDNLPDWLTLNDISVIKDCYFGVYVKKQNGTIYARATADTTIGAGGSLVDINAYTLQTGTYDVAPFLSEARIAQSDPDVASSYYTIPYMLKRTIRIVATYVSISVQAGEMPQVSGDTEVSVVIRNQSSSSITFTNNTWRVRFPNKDFADPMTLGETQGNISNITVQGNTTATVRVTVSVSYEMISNGTAMCWISLNSGSYLGGGMFIQSTGGGGAVY